MKYFRYIIVVLILVFAGISCGYRVPHPEDDLDSRDRKEDVRKEVKKKAEEVEVVTIEEDEEVLEEEEQLDDDAEEDKEEESIEENKKVGSFTLDIDEGSIVVLLSVPQEEYKGDNAYIEFGCDDYLVPVKIELEKPQSDLAEALVQLLTVRSDAYEGLNNAVWNKGLILENIHYEEGVRIIEFSGDVTSSGTCDSPRLKAQVEETIKLYSDNFKILLNGSEKNWECLFDESGLCG